MELAIVVTVVVVALVFDYTNGFHDASNAIATSISTRALTPRVALVMAAGMNFVGALLGQEVARTVQGVITIGGTSATHGLVVVLAALLGATGWNVLTWWLGLPSSSTHALIGGLVGAGLVGGVSVRWESVLDDVLVPMLAAPLAGFALAYAVMIAIMWAFRRSVPARVDRKFRLLQTLSAAGLALGHGLQDAQKTMGVIFLAVTTAGYYSATDDRLPLWIVLAAALAISLGTYAGGWRIMRTLGRRIIELDPARGFAAETAGTLVLYTTAFALHAPVSTTHTVTAAIAGAGATKRLSAVRWGVARRIVVGWLVTIPAAAGAAALLCLVLRGVLRLG
jgi:inorganic phosphate transporter, PiT family